ncbi:MAG: UPF0147 family protein [Archaeoglobaceae archaeon]|nr:UPF0147 family protein [Archaeoglobaceae archaeon]MCX8152613.1 UPF0147 family protein [Archaeoglobaceae archaeon]MDW8014105.1 UPF0147 family protein [Archaeoglobaceae archaeon]
MAKVPENVLEALNRIIFDDSVPRNVRKKASEIKERLLKTNKLALEAATAISVLEDISSDPNLPMHVRTMIWNLTSQLEKIAVE